jgi:hypothetical protein
MLDPFDGFKLTDGPSDFKPATPSAGPAFSPAG